MNDKIQLIIFDLDGTLYPKTEAYYEADYKALADAINEIDSNISKEEAYKLAKKSKQKYGKTYDIFPKEKGIPFDEMDKKFLLNLANKIPEFLQKSDELKAKLEDIKNSGVEIVIFTHNKKAFTKKVLKILDIEEIFNERNLFCRENIEQKKSEGTKTFETIAKSFNKNYQNMLIVDDESRNLIFPKKLGIKTVLITRQDFFPKKQDSDFLPDQKYDNISEVLNGILY